MDFSLNITDAGMADMTWNKADSLMNNIWLSLMVDRGSFFQNPDFGSRLYLLRRAKNTEATADLAREYCLEALQWLKDIGRAENIEVATQRDRKRDLNRLKILVRVEATDGREVSFETFLEVV